MKSKQSHLRGAIRRSGPNEFVRLAVPIASLRKFAARLNSADSVGRHAAARDNWASWVMALPVSTRAFAGVFEPFDSQNRLRALAGTLAQLFELEPTAAEKETFRGAGNAADQVALLMRMILRQFVGDHVAARIKKCPVCTHWFADSTRNRSMDRCSRACTWQWWSRSRRRAAQHAQYREPKSQKRGRNP